MRSRFAAVVALASLLVIVGGRAPVTAQTITGQFVGTVTDSSGGVLPGVTVTVTNDDTGLLRTAVTDNDGNYVVTALPVGRYTVAAELQGFRKAQRKGFDLNADGRLTANFSLQVGAVTETIEVVAVTSEKVNTTSGEIARVIDGEQVRELALNGRNYLQLVSLIPGAAVTNDDQLDLATSLSVTGQSINGNRGAANSLNVDGGSNLDSGSNGSQINNVGIDFIQEVKIQTSNFSAEYGRSSGAAINVVTRSGTNKFRGSAFEFFRHDSLDAANFFAPKDAAGNAIKGRLRFHDVGGAFGGPIKRGRLFFFVGQEHKYIRRAVNPQQRSLPTTAELNGNFALRLRGTDGIPGTADDGFIRDPLLAGTCSAADRTACFPGNVIPSTRITADGRALANTYRRGAQLAARYVDEPTPNNATFQPENPFDFRQDIVRIDLRASSEHSVYLRYLHDKYDLIEPFGTFINSNIPTIPTNRLRPGNSYQASHTWVASRNVVHETKINASWNGQRIPPVGEDWKRETYGYAFPQLYDGGETYANGIPNVDVSGFANFRGPNASLLSPTTDIAVQNTLTWLQGKHSLKGGAKYIRNRKDQNGRPAYLGVVNFSAGGNPNSTGQALADALLGNFRTYTEASADPIGFFRFNQYEGWASDNWRVRNNLSFELGVRYQYAPPMYSQQNNLVNFDPALYNPAQSVRMNLNGTIVPNSGFRFNGLVRGGNGIPDDQVDRVNIVRGADFERIPSGAPRGLYEGEHLFMPRVGFAYSPGGSGHTAIRGGVGLFYDRPEGNIVFSSVNLPPFLQIAQFENGNLANPSGGTPSALAPLGEISTIDPSLRTAYQVQYSASVQRELWEGYFIEVAYVGNKGRRLLWFPDINQATFEDLNANQALPSAQRASVNSLRPYKGYAQIRQRRSDALSNYNGLQLYATKRRGDLTFTVGYTLSKVLTSASAFGDNPEDPFNLEFNYGPASFDRRHIFVSTLIYQTPYMKQRGKLLSTALGGWGISVITRAQSGAYLTPTGNTAIGGRRADYVDGQEISLSSNERDFTRWFNAAAFVPAPDARRGTAKVGMILGPGRYAWDVSFRKRFPIGNGMRLGVQADFFNLLDNVNLGNPNTNVSAVDYGRIGSAGPARQTQFGVRLEF